MDKKLWKYTIEEHNGEQEYSHERYCLAVSQAQAERIARGDALHWYDGAKKAHFMGEENLYEAEGGALMWRLYMPSECQDIQIPITNGESIVIPTEQLMLFLELRRSILG